MRPAIVELLSRVAAALDGQAGAQVAVAREDLARLVSWTLAGDRREVNAYLKGSERATQTIADMTTGSSDGVHVCCRRTTGRILAYIREDTRRWRVDMMDRIMATEFRAIQTGAPHRRPGQAR